MSNPTDEDRIEGALRVAQQAMQRVSDVETQLEDLRDELEALREENRRLRDQEQMFRDARQNMQRTPEERAVTLVKTLNNEALTEQQLGRDPRAGMTLDAARKTLGGDLRRQQLHDAMETAERLVDDESVVWKRTGDPGRGGQDTHLRLDLTNGELPSTVAGEAIRQEPYEGADG